MWIATTDGFYSAVAHKFDKDLLVVRCRVLQDAETLARWVDAHTGQAAPQRVLRLSLSCHHTIEVPQPDRQLAKGDMEPCNNGKCGGRLRAIKKIKPVTAADTVTEVIAYEQSDYPWRVIIARTVWQAYLADAAGRVDYTNFKDEVTRKQGKARHDVYSKVWSAMLLLEKLPGAMRDHSKRAVPHPLFGSRRGKSSYRSYDDWYKSQPRLGDLAGQRPLFDDELFGHDDDEPEATHAMGDPGHEDCTLYACLAEDPLTQGVCA